MVTSKVQPRGQVAPLVAPFATEGATTFSDILDRLKKELGTKSDTSFAKALGLRQSSVSGAKKRQQIPPAWAVQVAARTGASLDWLLLGRQTAPPAQKQIIQDFQGNSPFDRRQIREAIIAAEEGLTQAKKKLDPGKKADLILAVYDLLEDEKETTKVVELIKIVV